MRKKLSLLEVINEDGIMTLYGPPSIDLTTGHPREKKKSQKYDLILHHLTDIEQALKKCRKALENDDDAEIVDNAVLMQSGAMDVEELVTGKKVKI